MSQSQYPQQYPIRTRQPTRYQQQQVPYSAPQQPQGYPPQGPPPVQGYPQQPFAQQSQQRLPQSQDTQRYYSPAPPEQSQPSQGFFGPYHSQNGPPSVAAPPSGTAPFHFIPGGIPPPQATDVRRKTSPNAGPPGGSSDPYSAVQGMQSQIRPNSIHTLNSGNPQELATGGYESPIDNRHSHPSAQMAPYMHPPAVLNHESYPLQQAAQSVRDDGDSLSIVQQIQSPDTQPGLYSGGQLNEQYSQLQQSPQPNRAPPGVPASPGAQPGESAAYQAYQPPQLQTHLPQRVPSGGGNEGDPGDFYR